MKIAFSAATMLALVMLASCVSHYGSVGLEEAPKIVNVSSFDPKERQRAGDSYSEHNVAALRQNQALGLIARCGKGHTLDDKCADFLSAADREGLRLGTYFFVLHGIDPVYQADRYIDRLQQIAQQKNLRGKPILLVGDFDSKSSPADLVAFINRIEQRTGVIPVTYLENSNALRLALSTASPQQKNRIRQSPYWIALYSHDDGFRTPHDLMQAYGIWNRWALWQYAGVEWKGRSVAKHYHHGPWKSPRFFGSMDRPLEHNAFNGSLAELDAFWAQHSWTVQ